MDELLRNIQQIAAIIRETHKDRWRDFQNWKKRNKPVKYKKANNV